MRDQLAAPLSQGTVSAKVRELQARLRAAKCNANLDVNDTFGPQTTNSVIIYQQRHELKATGVVDQVTWDSLINATPRPSEDELANQAPGKPYVTPAVPGLVKEFQHRLQQAGAYHGQLDGRVSEDLRSAAVAFQSAQGLPSHGTYDERTWNRLVQVTRTPAAELGFVPEPVRPQQMDPRCYQAGRVFCVSLQDHRATYLVDGAPVTSFEGRFGSESNPTYPGAYAIWAKDWTTVSTIFGERFPMAYAMFFHNDRAFHFSFDFVTDGYNGTSHGCVNMRSYDTIRWLYERVQVGDRVYVY